MTRKRLAFWTLCIVAGPASAGADVFLRMDDYDLHGVRSAGFDLPRQARVDVEAIGVANHWGDSFIAYAWLLDANTRRVVWSQYDDSSSGSRRNRDRLTTSKSLDLGPGRYELYSWAGVDWSDDANIRFGKLSDIFRFTDRHGDDRSFRHAVRDCYVELASTDIAKSDVKLFEPTGELPGALFSAGRLGDHAYLEKGLRVDRTVDLRLYGVFEWPRDWSDPVDAAWIVNADTRERVWEPMRQKTKPAGGAAKNRVFDGKVSLAPGRYVLHVGTDDCHSYDAFNAAPPYDPAGWGLQVVAASSSDAAAVHFEAAPPRGEPVVALRRARDSDFLETRFRLARTGEIFVYALGEWDDGNHEFADRAWISKPGSRDVVWEMDERDTHHAGGAEKNRMFDGGIRLEAGDYVVRYETDDSHSYRHWNAARPYDPEAWGITLYPGRGMSEKDFVVSDAVAHGGSDDAALPADAYVALTRVRDNEHERATFTLPKETRVRIYALGEGADRELFDHGWIEDTKTGNVVWEMTWRNTRHAGGARKNRVFDGSVLLEAGTYEVHYVTDGSHSFQDWNDRRPDDPSAWGITVSRAKE